MIDIYIYEYMSVCAYIYIYNYFIHSFIYLFIYKNAIVSSYKITNKNAGKAGSNVIHLVNRGTFDLV